MRNSRGPAWSRAHLSLRAACKCNQCVTCRQWEEAPLLEDQLCLPRALQPGRASGVTRHFPEAPAVAHTCSFPGREHSGPSKNPRPLLARQAPSGSALSTMGPESKGVEVAEVVWGTGGLASTLGKGASVEPRMSPPGPKCFHLGSVGALFKTVGGGGGPIDGEGAGQGRHPPRQPVTG